MAYREVLSVEIREIIRRWQAGFSQRRIARGTGLSRQTVRRYIEAAEAAGLRPGGPDPGEQQLAALATLSSTRPRRAEIPSEQQLSPWAEQIERWLQTERLQVTRIHELLAERGCEVSYSTLRRFIARRGWGRRQPVTVRMEDGPPGEVAELDFGRLGLIADPESGRRRTVWALIVVWRYSRHCFVWPTTSQRLDAVVEGLEAAWAFFGGVPRYLVIDNFPAAVAGADALHPRFTRGFLELRLRQAGFEQLCRLEDFDWSASIRLDRRLLDAACSLRFLDRREHVLLVGPVGVGKSFLAQALGYAAVRSGHSVRFVSADQYFRELAQARVDHTAEKAFRSFLAPDLLILDDLGLHWLSAQQSIDLYELIIGRHRSSSFVITSNRAVEEWLGLFDDPILGNSALDRLANASYQIVIEGESYRQRLSPHRALIEAQEGAD